MLTTNFMTGPIQEFNNLDEWQQAAKGTAIATVVRTWGSSPRPEGSHLAINEEGNFIGSVSGGCIEGAVVAEALELINDGKSRRLEFGVSDEQAWDVGLSCGGSVHVYVDKITPQDLMLLRDAMAKKQAIAQVTCLDDGLKAFLYDDSIEGELELNTDELAEAKNLLSSGRCSLLKNSQRDIFVRSYVPAYRLIIVGAVHIAQALAPMAALAGYEVTVVDPRSAFACAERFPHVNLINDWPDDALQALSIDKQTAIVTLSHDPKLDDPALHIALKSPAFYVGCLGSSRTHSKRIDRLTNEGLGDYLDRICAPVGIKLGGRAPEEIAVSVLAQIIQSRHNKTGITKLPKQNLQNIGQGE